MAKLIDKFIHPKFPKLYLLQRDDSKFLQARTFIDGRTQQWSTKTGHLPTAFRLAEAEYKQRQRGSAGEATKLGVLPLVGELYTAYRASLDSPNKRAYAAMKWGPMEAFWASRSPLEITAQTFRDFYVWRRKNAKVAHFKNHSLHKDMMVVRQILNFGIQEGHFEHLPPIPKVGKIEPNPRPWLTASEWDRLCALSEKRIAEAVHNPRLQQQRVDLDDQMRWMVASMMRVGEMLTLHFGDCREEKNSAGEAILVCDVVGKRGSRTVVARRVAAKIFAQRRKHSGYGKDPDALLFPVHHDEALTELLKAARLHVDPRTKFERNFKSLRATSISFEILRGAPSPNLLMIARNAGTSVSMIDLFYAKKLSAEMGKDALTSKQDDEY